MGELFLKTYSIPRSGDLLVLCPRCSGKLHRVSRDGLDKFERNWGYRTLPCGQTGFLGNAGIADAEMVEAAGR